MSNEQLQTIVACFGKPVAGNPTQYMMERAFEHHGLDWRYLTLEVDAADLEDAIRGMRAMGFRGANLTKPHKVSVIPLLDELTETAALMGAVNCIDRQGDRLLGDNADGKGFLLSLKELLDPQGISAVVLGAGGAARAIAVELAQAGAEQITVVNRSPQRGQELVELLNEKTPAQTRFQPWENQYTLNTPCDVLINATSIGLFDPQARVPVDSHSLELAQVVADVVFNPVETRFLQEAAAAGAKTLNGLGMLVNQAAICFQRWTGVEPESTVMREALEEFFGM